MRLGVADLGTACMHNMILEPWTTARMCWAKRAACVSLTSAHYLHCTSHRACALFSARSFSCSHAKVLGNLLGILNNSSQDYFQYDSSKKISNEDIELMIKERDQARLNKDFKKADLIREKLSSLNIALEDDGEKTIWKKLV